MSKHFFFACSGLSYFYKANHLTLPDTFGSYWAAAVSNNIDKSDSHVLPVYRGVLDNSKSEAISQAERSGINYWGTCDNGNRSCYQKNAKNDWDPKENLQFPKRSPCIGYLPHHSCSLLSVGLCFHSALLLDLASRTSPRLLAI